MTSPTILIQRAAELVIEFGLEHTGMTAAEVRNATDDSGLIVLWRPPCDRLKLPRVTLDVRRRTCSLTARVDIEADGLTSADAKRVFEFAGRVAEIAERIEALR
jgi:hypothetical protein